MNSWCVGIPRAGSRPVIGGYEAKIEKTYFERRSMTFNVCDPFRRILSKRDQGNYHKIIGALHFSRYLEKFLRKVHMLRYLPVYLYIQPVLSQNQHGFTARRSYDSHLAALLKTAWNTVTFEHQIDIIYTDYSAAFQSVNQQLLTRKLPES